MIATLDFLLQVIKEELEKLGYAIVDSRRVVEPIPIKTVLSEKIKWYQIGNSRYHAPLYYYKTIFLFDLTYDTKDPIISIYVNRQRFTEQQARDLVFSINGELRKYNVTNFLKTTIYMDVVPSDSISTSLFSSPPKNP